MRRQEGSNEEIERNVLLQEHVGRLQIVSASSRSHDCNMHHDYSSSHDGAYPTAAATPINNQNPQQNYGFQFARVAV